jgi:hypothetical protein
MAEELGFNFQHGKEIVLFSMAFSPPLESIQLPIHWTPEALPTSKLPMMWSKTLTSHVAEIKNT